MVVRGFLGGALVLIAMLAVGCAGRVPMTGQEVSGLDRRLSPYTFIEDGDLVSFLINTRATRYRNDQSYVPLEILVANRGLRQLSLTRESFTLVDGDGTRYPVAGPRELIESYPFLDMDRSLQEVNSVTSRFAAFTRYPSNFSPLRGAGSRPVRDRVALPKFGYIIDFLYFPRPANGLRDAVLELFLDAPELQDPVFVRFEVAVRE